MSGVHQPPDGPAFDIVLVLHVGCVVVGLVTFVTSRATATRLGTLLRTSAPFPDAVSRYFRPGPNWAGRTVYGIPLFGFILLALSSGAYSLGDGWVEGGLGLLVVVVLVAEGALWPAERRLQGSLVGLEGGGTPVAESVLQDVKVMGRAATVATVLLVAGSLIMLVQP
jgi:hypothetical protein